MKFSQRPTKYLENLFSQKLHWTNLKNILKLKTVSLYCVPILYNLCDAYLNVGRDVSLVCARPHMDRYSSLVATDSGCFASCDSRRHHVGWASLDADTVRNRRLPHSRHALTDRSRTTVAVQRNYAVVPCWRNYRPPLTSSFATVSPVSLRCRRCSSSSSCCPYSPCSPLQSRKWSRKVRFFINSYRRKNVA